MYHREVYLWLSAGLLVPVVIWPMLLTDIAPEAYLRVAQGWMFSGAALLLAAAVADSVLAGAKSMQAALAACLWVLVTSTVFLIASHAFWASWLIAALFALHALRSALPLWQQQGEWWHWYAWLRDSAAALVMFFWIARWPV